METPFTMETMNKCRVCLEDGPMTNIFEEDSFVIISKKLIALAKVQVHPEDGLPQSICLNCLRNLNFCLEFIQLCQDSDSKLRRLLETDVIGNENFCKKFSNLSAKTNSLKEIIIDESSSQSFEDFSTKKCESLTVYDTKAEDSKKKEKQQCFTCGKVMSSRYRLKTHLRTHTGERPFSCSHCNKTFSVAENLKVHLRTHTGEKPLSCPECDESFAHTAGLAAHRRKHTGQKPYQCMLCPRTFRTIGHLQYHTRRHTGEKNFECESCDRAFITRSDLKKHILSHTGEKPHVCCACGLRLSRASHLKRHIQLIHKGDTSSSFTCSFCSLKFLQKADFEKHKLNHGACGNGET